MFLNGYRPTPIEPRENALMRGLEKRFGAVVAGLNCQHVGCVPPTRPEVDAALARRQG